VEWGWCRDLQSFIFIFRSHNRFLLSIMQSFIFIFRSHNRLFNYIPFFFWSHRIVLERPEYGYATYFFEVVQSLPIEWQVRRLVIAMKLSGCGRTALIENKPLLVCFHVSLCLFSPASSLYIVPQWVPVYVDMLNLYISLINSKIPNLLLTQLRAH
jgi:hypothetical protein